MEVKDGKIQDFDSKESMECDSHSIISVGKEQSGEYFRFVESFFLYSLSVCSSLLFLSMKSCSEDKIEI